MQAKLDAVLQEVEDTQKLFVITEDDRYMISEQLQWAIMELNATNEALI